MEAEYFIYEGTWYQVSNDHIKEVCEYIDRIIVPTKLPPYEAKHGNFKNSKWENSEGKYNSKTGEIPGYICLDTKDISPKGQKQIEPCDLLEINKEKNELILHHIKISTDSSKLSHLFNQGHASLQLLLRNKEALGKLKKMAREFGGEGLNEVINTCIENKKFAVHYGIISNKRESKDIPLLSRLLLYTLARRIKSDGKDVWLSFIEDKVYEGFKAVRMRVCKDSNGVTVVKPADDHPIPKDVEILGFDVLSEYSKTLLERAELQCDVEINNENQPFIKKAFHLKTVNTEPQSTPNGRIANA